uniref:Uncharacterized protein n=1 Tax=Lotharella oceanica TaxID=641309 RepID=A0A7S2TSV8_9EUKA
MASDTSSSRKRKREEAGASEDDIKKLVTDMVFEDEDGINYKVKSHKILDSERGDRYAGAFPSLRGGTLVGCVCTKEEDEDDDDGDAKAAETLVEHVVVVKGSEKKGPGSTGENGKPFVATPFFTECKISYEPVSPAQLVEYRFDEADTWHLGVSTRASLEMFRRTKFSVWKDLLMKTQCSATLRSLLGLGPITRLFDRFALPTPETDKKFYETKDDNGKTIHIPHPVAALRVWNAATQAYDPIKAHLEGAPESKEEVDAFWAKTLADLREAHGKETIDKLLKEGVERFKDLRTQAKK